QEQLPRRADAPGDARPHRRAGVRRTPPPRLVRDARPDPGLVGGHAGPDAADPVAGGEAPATEKTPNPLGGRGAGSSPRARGTAREGAGDPGPARVGRRPAGLPPLRGAEAAGWPDRARG